jgi:DNA helicase II / ATP-dependent DNA helicase PcrA
MEPGTLIKRAAAQTWRDYQAKDGVLRGQPGALTLREMLEDVAERCYQMSVIPDKSLLGTNIEGQLDRANDAIRLRPDLDPFRALFVLAHELGHRALEHPLHLYSDTSAEINFEVSPESLSAAREERLTGGAMTATAVTSLRGYSPQEFTELQANAYATELLVPGAWLRDAFAADPHRTALSVSQELGVPESLVFFGMSRSLLKASHPEESEGAESEVASNDDALPSHPLDKAQQYAVDCPAPALIIAGPGAGKTKVLVARYARHTEEGLKPDQILPLTFANKAAGEMRERIAALLPPDQAGQIAVFTFHALGLQLLQQYGAHLGLKLPLRLITPLDALLLFRRHAARMSFGSLSDLPQSLENLHNMLKAVARSKDENAGPERWDELVESWKANEGTSDTEMPTWAKDGPRFYREYQRTLRRFRLLDYGDLLMLSLRLFDIPEVADEIRKQYRVILVDETQDINYVSGLLVRALNGGRDAVWAVGDPRQSIYGFRGASPVNLIRFKSAEYYPKAEIVYLTTNYRSVPDVVAAGAAVRIPFPADSPVLPPALTAYRPPESNEPAVTSVHFPDGGQEMRWLAAEIARLRSAGTPLSDIAVLTRTRNHAAQVAEALTAAGVTHRWGGPLEERPVFRLLMSALLLAADETAGIVGLTTISPGANLPPDVSLSEPDRRILLADGRRRQRARRLLSSAVEGNISGISEEGIRACRELLEIAGSLKASSRPFQNLILYLFGRPGNWFRRLLIEPFKSEPAAQVVLAVIGQTLDLATDFAAQRESLARTLESPPDEDTDSEAEPILVDTEASTSAFIDYLRSALDADALDAPHELDTGADAVWILTAHRSKGLEWPVVFVPFSAEKEFPSTEKPDKVPLPPGLIVGEENSSERHHRDEACLFYVAVTRARDQAYLSGADKYSKSAGKSALRAGIETQLASEGWIRLPQIAVSEAPTETSPEEVWIPYELPELIHEKDLETYRTCPRQFLYKHIYGLPDADTAYLRYHRALYGALQDAQQEPERLREFFDKRWQEDGPPESHWRNPLFLEDAARRIQQAAMPVTEGEERKFRVEKTFPLGTTESGKSYSLKFTVDEERRKADGGTALLRHKQGTRVPKESPDEARMTLYALYAEQQQETSVAYYYPRIERELPPSVGKVKKKNYLEKRLQMISDIEAGKMSANPKACKECPYILACEGV